MKSQNPEENSFQSTQNLSRLIDYKVIDSADDKVGTVDAVWEDHTGQPAYLAIRTGWLGMGKAHIVPVQLASVNNSQQTIRLPYTAEKIKNAPSFDSQYDFTEESDATIATYYRTSDGQTSEMPEVSEETRARATGDSEEARVQLKSEELKVGKREVEYGGVRLRKIVRTETVNQPVELSREEIVIERIPVSEAAGAAASSSFSDEELYIPLRREEAVVQKTVRANEEVLVSKRRESERENVQETLRHEDVEIEQDADSKLKKR